MIALLQRVSEASVTVGGAVVGVPWVGRSVGGTVGVVLTVGPSVLGSVGGSSVGGWVTHQSLSWQVKNDTHM